MFIIDKIREEKETEVKKEAEFRKKFEIYIGEACKEIYDILKNYDLDLTIHNDRIVLYWRGCDLLSSDRAIYKYI